MTETNAEKAIEELKTLQADLATVLRGGRLKVVPASELVPGDVVEVTVGAKVPSDARIVQIFSSQLRCDQSILTGESDSMLKDIQPCASVHVRARPFALFTFPPKEPGRGPLRFRCVKDAAV